MREAIDAANAAATDDTVSIPAGTYTLTITNAAGDEDANASGDLDVVTGGASGSIAIVGAGATDTTIDATAVSDRVFDVNGAATVSFQNLSVTGGDTVGGGGGIWIRGGGTGSLSGVGINQNASDAGGGGLFVDGGTTTVTESRIFGNRSSTNGGGLRVENAGTLNIDNSEVSENSLNATLVDGGGLFVQGNSASTVQNTTFYQNEATGHGGGIHVNTNGDLTLRQVTIASNSADSDANGDGHGGGFLAEGTGTVNIANSIVANNVQHRTGTPVAESCSDTLGGVIVPTGVNLVDDITNCPGWGASDLTGVSADLGMFGDNGSYRRSVVPGLSSPAINAGDATVCSLFTVDQRGLTRTVGSSCDLGAVEAGNRGDLGVEFSPANPGATVGSAVNVTFTVTNNGSDPLFDTTLVITLPAGLSGVASSTSFSCTGTTTITCTLSGSGIDVSGAPTITVAMTPAAAQSYDFTVAVSHTATDPVTSNDNTSGSVVGTAVDTGGGSGGGGTGGTGTGGGTTTTTGGGTTTGGTTGTTTGGSTSGDVVAPKVTFVSSSPVAKVNKKRKFKVTLACPVGISGDTCSAVIQFKIKGRGGKQVRFSCTVKDLKAGASTTSTCSISRKLYKKLKKGKNKGTAVITGSDSSSTTGSSSSNFVLRR